MSGVQGGVRLGGAVPPLGGALIMRQAASGRGFIRRVLVGLATIAALAPPAWGYINGGTYHNTLDGYQERLKAEGWGVSVGGPMSGHAPRGAVGLAFVPPDSPEHPRYVNQLVGRALRALPGKDASQV